MERTRRFRDRLPAWPQAGVTLLDVAVALTVVGVALAAVAGMVRAGLRTVVLVERRVEAQHALRVALDRLTEEVRWVEAVLDDPECGLCAHRLTVRVSPHNPRRPGEAYVVRFERDAVGRELERRVGGAVNNLAGSLDDLVFRYFTLDGRDALRPEEVARVEVTITASEGPLIPASGSGRRATSGVFLRNRAPPFP